MEVTLPSGHTAVFRDQFLRGDRREAQRGIVVVISADGSRRLEGSIGSEIASRVIRRMLVSWSFENVPVPGQAQSEFLAEQILDGLDEADAAALEKAVQPWVARVLRVDAAEPFTHVATGVQVMPVNQADAEKLAGHPDFTREGEADPKPGSGSTAISSPASLASPGQQKELA